MLRKREVWVYAGWVYLVLALRPMEAFQAGNKRQWNRCIARAAVLQLATRAELAHLLG